MLVRLQNLYNIVSLHAEDWLTLQSVDETGLHFELKYHYNVDVGLAKKITKIAFEVAKYNVPSVKPSRDTSREAIDSVLAIRTSTITKLIKYDEEAVLVKKNSDPTKRIANDQISSKNSVNREDVNSDMAKALRTLSVQHDLAITFDDTVKTSVKLLSAGVDPSSAYAMKDPGLTLDEMVKGTTSNAHLNSAVDKLLYKYKTLPFALPITQSMPGETGLVNSSELNVSNVALNNDSTNNVVVKDNFVLSNSNVNESTLVVTLRAQDSSGVTVQTITRTFQPAERLKFYNIPKLPPIAKISDSTDKLYTTVCIRQQDPRARGVKVYKRKYGFSVQNTEPYTLIADIELSASDGWKYLPLSVAVDNPLIYRFVAVGINGELGTSYDSIVVKPRVLNAKVSNVSIAASSEEKRVKLEVSNIPQDVVSFKVMKQDYEIDRSKLLSVSDVVFVNRLNSVGNYVVYDNNVKSHSVYVYVCRMYQDNGNVYDKICTHHEHVPYAENLVDIKLLNPALTNNNIGYDFSFTIQANFNATKTDELKTLLEAHGSYDVFFEDIAEIRSKLGDLTAFSVKRLNLTTGDVENMGIHKNNTTFVDSENTTLNGSSNLQIGTKYRYFVSALARSPETMLEEYIKTTVDKFTKRTYQYSPFKFYHPIVRENGQLVEPDTVKYLHTQEQMTFGELGVFDTIDVDISVSAAVVENATLETIDSNTMVAQWSMKKDVVSSVDHFVVFYEKDKVRKTLDRVHCSIEQDSFLHVFEKNLDLVNAEFYVAPVMFDFTQGDAILMSGDSS